MKKTLLITYNWLGFILLILSLFSNLLNISVFGSSYIFFYGISVTGLIIGFMGWILLKFNTVDLVTKIVGKIGFLGNLLIVILFFPPIYFIWGTFIFGP